MPLIWKAILVAELESSGYMIWLILHSSAWTDTDSAKASYEFHNPLRAIFAGAQRERLHEQCSCISALSIMPGNLILSAFRLLDDKSYELRFYESSGTATNAVITFRGDIDSAHKTDFNGKKQNDPENPISFSGRNLTLQ